jgi:hypothetical protein
VKILPSIHPHHRGRPPPTHHIYTSFSTRIIILPEKEQ